MARQPDWTADEEGILRAEYARDNSRGVAKRVARLLGRSGNAVQTRAEKLQLRATRKIIKPVVRCAHCGRTFSRYNAELRRAKRPVCSRQCRDAHQKGPCCPNWKGGRVVEAGRVLIYRPDHPGRNKGNYVPEHRLIMEGVLGRLLTRDEVVHHEDGDGTNNNPENLTLFSSNAEHLAKRHGGSYRKLKRSKP